MSLSYKISLQKNIDVILVWSFIFVFMGSSIYFVSTAITPGRISLMLLALAMWTYRKNSIKLDTISLVLVLLYSYQFLINAVISFIDFTILSNSFFYSFHLYMYILMLILISNFNRNQYLEFLFKATRYVIAILMIVSFIEYTYQIHLPGSSILKEESIYWHIPTAFYTNQNDLAAIYSLTVMFYSLYMFTFKIRNKFDRLFLYIAIFYGFFLTIITTSSINMITTSAILFIATFKVKRFSLLLIISLIMLFAYIYYDVLQAYYSIYEAYSQAESGGNSLHVRTTLYRDALENITIFGYGFDNSSLFYESLNDGNLFGIVNPHNFILELLINNGIIFFIFFILLNAYFFIKAFFSRKYFLSICFILYFFVLMSSSSSLFLWPHYLYYIGFISMLYANDSYVSNLKGKICKIR